MPENISKYQERLVSLRKQIKKQGLVGFILPRTDEFQGEFLAPYAERLAWLSGFNGSAGAAVILLENAVVLSDSRYTIQLKDQVDSDLYDTDDITQNPVGSWLAANASSGDKIGYDTWLYTKGQLEKITAAIADKNIELVPLDFNLIDKIWNDQPTKPQAQVTVFPDEIAGRSSAQKRSDLAEEIQGEDCEACIITVCDSICWLLNVRGGDVEYSPLVLSYVILYADGTLDWFVDRAKLSAEILAHVGDGVSICCLDDMASQIRGIKGMVAIDSATCPVWFEGNISKCKEMKDPCVLPKSIKSKTEQEAVRLAHINDGVALVKFLKWLDEAGEPMSELSVEAKLEGFRKENPDFIAPSFATIAGFADNGAVVHYRATKESEKEIIGDGLLLVDSGGQYRWGTTDITRTIAIGTPSNEMRENYTRVLKGHIAVASARFKKGTLGKEIDVLARKSLQEVGLDYGHGTGHGVGCYLCVHEAAAHISPRGEVAFEAGMLISNEPGFYKEGEYGIRIESLILVQECEEDSSMLYFDTVAFAPFDPKLIDMDMLEAYEKSWLALYANDILENISPHLSDTDQTWLNSFLLSYWN